MYIPSYYQETNEDKLVGFMRAHSFALLASAQDSSVRATHLPFIVEKRDNKVYLVSHIAKANPQWNEFGNELLIIFQGPHGYVSPAHYEKEQNVPTWNYIAVHAYGKASIVEEPVEVIKILEKMITNYEAGYYEQWKRLSDVYKNNMMKGIVAFEIEVIKLEGKYKLSQNKTEHEKAAIAKSFADSADPLQGELADEMKKQ